jgi:tetratricopeptide (TPR) repeat protein
LAKAQSLPALAADNDVKIEDPKAKEVLDTWIAGAKEPGADRNAVLPELAKATMNMVLNIRDVVMERYGLVQMYADSLLNRGKAEQLAKRDAPSKAAYKEALDLFTKCFDLDDACRKGEAAWIAKKYAPFIADVKANAKGTGAVSRMVEDYRKTLKDAGLSQAMSADMSSMEYAVKYLRGAPNQEQEQERLPRAVDMLVRGWENLVRTLQNQTTIDHVNIIGMARAQRGLGKYGEAMALYRRYTEGIPMDKFPKIYWHAELERCQCNLDGYLSNPEAMKNLVIQINSLRIKDKEMGGLAGEFEQIKKTAGGKAGQGGK